MIARHWIKAAYILISLHLGLLAVVVGIADVVGLVLPLEGMWWIGAAIFFVLVFDFGVKYLDKNGLIRE